MYSVEKRLKLLDEPEEKEEPFSEDKRGQILALSEKLAEPEVSAEARLAIAAQIRLLLLGETTAFAAQMPNIPMNTHAVLEHAPPHLTQAVAA